MKYATHLIGGIMLASITASSFAVAADDSAQKKEILAAMDSWKHAMMTKDKAGLATIFHDDLQYGHSTGEVQDKPTTIKRDISSPNTYAGVDFTDTKIAFYGDTAIVTGHNVFHIIDAGKKRDVAFTALAVWEKGKTGWQLLARQVTKAP